MKNVFAILLSMICTSTYGQDYGFEVIEGKGAYRHVFEYEGVTLSDLEDMVRSIPNVENVTTGDSYVTGNVTKYVVPYLDYVGKKFFIVELPLSKGAGIEYFWRLDLRPGRYRLAINEFRFEPYDMPLGEYIWRSDELIKDGELRSGRSYRNTRMALDIYFRDVFQLKDHEEEEW